MSLLLGAAFKVSAVLFVGLCAAALLRTRSAALRHWVLAAAIVCAAAAPLIGLIVPAWHVPAVAWSSSSRTVDPGELIVAADATAAGADTAIARGNLTPMRRLLTAPRVLVALWLLGSALSALLLIVGIARLSWLAARARPIAAGRWVDAAETIGRANGIARPVTLLQSEHPSLLVTWGLLRPKVLLPAPARDWPDDRVRVVLSHELAHVRRGDWAVQILGELLRAAYWFNPLVWIACRQVRQQSEHACDDVVLSLGVEAPDYAAHLLDVARAFRSQRQLWSPALAIARPSSLERRVRAMLNSKLDRHPITRSACVLAVAALLAVTLPIAGFTAFADAASTTLSGTVVDQLGRGVPSVTIGLSDGQTRARHEVRTDQTGHFEFVALPSGEYAIDAKQLGFTTFQASVTLTGEAMRHDVTLQIGQIHETVNVAQGAASRPRKVSGSSPARRIASADPCLNSPAGGCIMAPMKIVDVRPIYPDGATAKPDGSVVKIDAQITADGSVAGAQASETADPAFANAAIDAVSQWKFTPTHLDGTPVETRMSVVVTFRPQ